MTTLSYLERFTTKRTRLWSSSILLVSWTLPIMAHAVCTSSCPNHQLQNQLNLLNKSLIESIESPDGDIIDCINIYDQPAFDHPLLKDHIIQMTPTTHIDNAFKHTDSSNRLTQLWHTNKKCPEQTIPIRRTTTSQDILRTDSIQGFGRKHHTIPQSIAAKTYTKRNFHEYATISTKGEKYYGAKASINVWNPRVQTNEFSLSQIWVVVEGIESIEAGWQIFPKLFGDNNTRLFIYWTADGHKSTGCYNMLCSGFLQIDNEIALGATLGKLSTYGGSQQDLDILIFKDPETSNWWLQFGNGIIMGYWPSILFSHLSKSATKIHWGGEITNKEVGEQHTTTQMGSGHFPVEGFGKASYIRNIKYVDESTQLRNPKSLHRITSEPTCYNLKTHKNEDMGIHFYYGGPGRNPNCPAS